MDLQRKVMREDSRGITQGVAQGDYTDALPDQLAGLHDQGSLSIPGSPLAPSPRLVLNPRWVACLMGFPPDWLDGIDSPPSPRSAKKRATSSQGGDVQRSARSGTRSSRKSAKSLPDGFSKSCEA